MTSPQYDGVTMMVTCLLEWLKQEMTAKSRVDHVSEGIETKYWAGGFGFDIDNSLCCIMAYYSSKRSAIKAFPRSIFLANVGTMPVL